MVASVDESDPAGSRTERTHGRGAAEAAAHHDDMRDRLCCMIAHPQPGAGPSGSQTIERKPPRPLRRNQQQQQRDLESIRRHAGEEDRGCQSAQQQRHGPRRQAEQERPAQKEHPPGCGHQLACEGHRPHDKAGPAGDCQREIEARPNWEHEIAESVAAGVEPADRPHGPDRHSREPTSQQEVERQRAGAAYQQPDEEDRLRPGQMVSGILPDAKNQSQGHRAGRQARRKRAVRCSVSAWRAPRVPPRTPRPASSS